MTFHSALLEDVAAWLAANGIGVYRETGIYQGSERGIVALAFPESPAEIISISVYEPEYTALSPTAAADLVSTRLQIRWRTVGDPREGVKVFDRLHALIDRKRIELGDRIVRGKYRSYMALGQDANNRWLFTSNWSLSAFASRTP